MKNNKASAFSLIELSIVILIIGILVAGVTQSSRLVAKMRTSSAVAQTQSSPVASIKNLIFWLETVSDKSFDDAAEEDTTPIANVGTSTYSWYDINPQVSQRSNAANTTSSATSPTYLSNCISNLPCLKFTSASSQFVNITQTNGVASQITAFIVFNPQTLPGAGSWQTLLAVNADHTLANNSFQVRINNNFVEYSFFPVGGIQSAVQSGIILSTNTNYIAEAYDNGTNLAGSQFISVNNTTTGAMVKVLLSPATLTSSKNLNVGLNIGSWINTPARYFNGYIGEVILFDRALKAEERTAIEKYLGKKWGIKV